MEIYIGSGLCFPIAGRSEVGMTLSINLADLLSIAANEFNATSGVVTVTVLPLKPENVTAKKTHSIKLTKIETYK